MNRHALDALHGVTQKSIQYGLCNSLARPRCDLEFVTSSGQRVKSELKLVIDETRDWTTPTPINRVYGFCFFTFCLFTCSDSHTRTGTG